MRIVQTFWSGNKSLIDNSFGWLSPQYHLMAWALSCLKLKEHYESVCLYTDSRGYDTLINYLKLPYTSVDICYDNLNCYHENLWALPKIMTYRAQNTPFIHVDGDVFVWDRFSDEIENAALISQNLEIGTEYYRTFMDEIKTELKFIPDILENELLNESIGSYNAGVLGGSDINFFKDYTDQAVKFIDLNYNNPNIIPSINVNILFEQILFYALCKNEKKEVVTIFKETFNDNGYTTSQFADFSCASNKLKYLHVIGPKKREENICELLSRELIANYPEYYLRIILLFNSQHVHLENLKFSNGYSELKCSYTDNDNRQFTSFFSNVKLSMSAIVGNVSYKNILPVLPDRWLNISVDELFKQEKRSSAYYSYFFLSKQQQMKIILERNPYIEIIEESFDWPMEVREEINVDLVDDANGVMGVALIPQLFFAGIKQVLIDELDYNILVSLEQPSCILDIISLMEPCFSESSDEEVNKTIYELIIVKLRKLFFYKCIFIR